MIYDWPRRAHWWLAGNEKFTAAPIAVRRRALMYRCVKETCDSRIDAPRRLGRCVEHWLERSFFWRGAMTRGKHVNAFQCFVLPYEPEYTAHRDDERACRVTKLHLKAREYVQGPAIAPSSSTSRMRTRRTICRGSVPPGAAGPFTIQRRRNLSEFRRNCVEVVAYLDQPASGQRPRGRPHRIAYGPLTNPACRLRGRLV